MSEEFLPLLVMGIDEAKAFQKKMQSRGVEIALNHSDQTCTRGCRVTLEVCGRRDDIPAIKEELDKDYATLLEGHDYDTRLLNEVFDPSADSAVCPACGCKFATTSSECPDCGLMF